MLHASIAGAYRTRVVLPGCAMYCFLQAKVDETYKNPAKWDRMSIMMTAGD
jgi:hypothetical protein